MRTTRNRDRSDLRHDPVDHATGSARTAWLSWLPTTRRGLAPLELALCLPVLLFTMALMVNFSTSTCWKVRSATNARYGAYRARDGWRGGNDAIPPDWPQNAAIGSTGGAAFTVVNQDWQRPEIDRAAFHGPVITNEGPYPSGQNGRINVYSRRALDMSSGTIVGTARIQRRQPLLPTLRQVNFNLRHDILDSRWQFWNMGYSYNEARRAKGWYNFETDPAWSQQLQRYRQADQAIVSFPQRESLAVLDRDDEFPTFYGLDHYIDFYPRIPGGCTDDVMSVRLGPVESLLTDIRGRTGGGRGGFADRMASRFIRLYQDQMALLQAQMPPPQGQIQQLQNLITQLQRFQATLN